MKRSVTSSTVAVMLATLLSMILGFAREVVNAKYFGERWELDAFLVLQPTDPHLAERMIV